MDKSEKVQWVKDRDTGLKIITPEVWETQIRTKSENKLMNMLFESAPNWFMPTVIQQGEDKGCTYAFKLLRNIRFEQEGWPWCGYFPKGRTNNMHERGRIATNMLKSNGNAETTLPYRLVCKILAWSIGYLIPEGKEFSILHDDQSGAKPHFTCPKYLSIGTSAKNTRNAVGLLTDDEICLIWNCLMMNDYFSLTDIDRRTIKEQICSLYPDRLSLNSGNKDSRGVLDSLIHGRTHKELLQNYVSYREYLKKNGIIRSVKDQLDSKIESLVKFFPEEAEKLNELSKFMKKLF